MHDRVQEAAYSLVPEEQRAPAHLRIGRLLARQIGPDQREEAVFEIVGHFNRAAALLTSEEERDRLQRSIWRRASARRRRRPIASALNYLTAGVSPDGQGWLAAAARPDLRAWSSIERSASS